MAYDYNKLKQMYQSMSKEQQQQFAEKNKDDANFQRFAQEYAADISGNKQTTAQYNSTNNQTDQGATSNTTVNTTPTIQKTENQTYWKTEFDKNEELDKSMFGSDSGKITVKEWTAQQTWKPDYTLYTDARLNEMKSNLDHYFATSPRMFDDRETFNKVFQYNERESDAQRQLLDSYWKRKQDVDNASKYNTWDSISNWMDNAEITTDQLNYIKEMSPEAYREWQQKQIDDINLRIANMATPADPTDTAELFNNLMQKLNLEPWDPYQVYDNWYNMADRLEVFSDSEKLKSYQKQLDQNHSKMEGIMNRYANSAWWTVSDTLAAARMQKALAPYQQIESDLQNSYTTLLNWRNSNLAIANQSANALAMQAAEDQRIFNQRLQWLGFAMSTAAYRSPEQQAQLQLQTQQITNDMQLLYQSQANDLNLYNQYATVKLQNQLQQELTDLSVEDEAQLKANLNNALSTYYQQYGDIIQRSQAQAVDDIIAYAKEKWISVAEALTENFIKPLQNKPEYKQKIASSYGMLSQQSIWTINWRSVIMTTNPNWTISYQYIDDLDAENAGTTKPYDMVDPKVMTAAPMSYPYNTLWTFLINKNNQVWKNWGQCWKFVNDYLEWIGLWRYYDDELSTKLNSVNSDVPVEWSIAVFDYGHTSSDWVNHWHVGIVTKVNNDWTIEVLDSNYDLNNPWTITKRTVRLWSSSLKWFFDPSKPPRATSTGSNLSSVDEAKKQNYLEEARRGQMTNTDITKIWNLAAEQGRGDEWREALKQGMSWNLTESQIKYMDKTDATFYANPIVKEFEEAINQIQQLQVALNDNSWVWDMSAIFTFMKTLDPSSVVRESEFESAAQTAWVLNAKAIRQKLEKSYDGKFLTPQQREDFKKIAREFIRIKAKNYQAQYDHLANRYAQFWIDVNSRWPVNLAEQVMAALSWDATWPEDINAKYFDWYYTVDQSSIYTWVWSVANTDVNFILNG